MGIDSVIQKIHFKKNLFIINIFTAPLWKFTHGVLPWNIGFSLSLSRSLISFSWKFLCSSFIYCVCVNSIQTLSSNEFFETIFILLVLFSSLCLVLDFSSHARTFNILMSFGLHHFIMQIQVTEITIQCIVDSNWALEFVCEPPCFWMIPFYCYSTFSSLGCHEFYPNIHLDY